MVTLDGENRYYGRGATGNRILTEGDVARLYARRDRWEIDRRSWLDEALRAMPFQFENPLDRIGPMLVLVRPIGAPARLLDRARGEQDAHAFLQTDLTKQARARDPYPDQGTSGIGDALDVARRGAGVWILQRDRDLSFPYQARLEVQADGALAYWHAPVINSHEGRDGVPVLLIMERSVTRAAFQALSTASWLYDIGGYAGAVDIGVGVLGIEHATGAALTSAFGGPAYGAPDYRHEARVTTTDLRQGPEAVTRELLSGLFDVISPRDYDPFADGRP